MHFWMQNGGQALRRKPWTRIQNCAQNEDKSWKTGNGFRAFISYERVTISEEECERWVDHVSNKSLAVMQRDEHLVYLRIEAIFQVLLRVWEIEYYRLSL